MLTRICDLCGHPAQDRFDSIFEIKGNKYRFAVIKVNIRNGVRWSEADVCATCMKKCRTGKIPMKTKGAIDVQAQ